MVNWRGRVLGVLAALMVAGWASAQGGWEYIETRDLLTGEDESRVSLRETQQGQFQFREGVLSVECRGSDVALTLEHDWIAFPGTYALQYRAGGNPVRESQWIARSGGETRGSLLYLAANELGEFIELLLADPVELVIRFDDQTYLFHPRGAGDALSRLSCVPD